MSVLVVCQQRDGKWNSVSFEALSAAQSLAEKLNAEVDAVVLGSGLDAVAASLSKYPAKRIVTLDSPLLKDYTPDAYTAALEQLIQARHYKFVLFPHTYQVRDYAPKLAARMGHMLVSDVVDMKFDSEPVVLVRQLFQGKLNADVQVSGEPNFISVQAGAFRAAEPGGSQAAVESFPVTLEAQHIRGKPEEPFRESQRSVDLSAANVIVSVGRGIKDKENLALVEELAQVLGAELAASRPICDNGWLPMERQVGSSGQTVAPKLYLAVGISGAIQHLVGMKGSKTVIAINKDENAPIFETADYAIVGDLFEIVPALVEELKKVKA
ncbi:MAG TPA: electron transfer flavoprotein subunit alpha/FixB family protein [Bryobacteraceae bacterium]|jgi:electron transfer flavoprotein alpha subunit|nr:electron transfer flavoprotein subunit alpha/FixB family protein [Bryobacteraceae bacterium]